jgi:hypothetical protein
MTTLWSSIAVAALVLWATSSHATPDSTVEDCQKGNARACDVYAASLDRPGQADEARPWLTKACSLSHGVSCLKLGAEQLSLLNDDAAIRWYDKACDLGEAEGCYAMATYWSAKMRNAVDAERARCADKGLAYADKALALKPKFVLAVLRKQLFWDERATFGDPARSDEAYAKVRALKAEREDLTRQLRASNDTDLLLGQQHDFESRPVHSKGPIAVAAGQPRSLEGGVGFECAAVELGLVPKPKIFGKATVVSVHWTAPEGKSASLPIDETPPWNRTHLNVGGKNYAAVAVLSDGPAPPGERRSFMPLANFLADGTGGGRKLIVHRFAYRLLFDVPVSAVGLRTLHAVMELPATGARYEMDCSLDGPRK